MLDYAFRMAFKRIVCATDFSTDAGAALRRAVMLAQEHRATLEVLHVVSRESLNALQQWVPDPVGLGERLVQAVREELDRRAGDAAREAGIRIDTRVVVSTVPWHALGRIWSANVPSSIQPLISNAAALGSSPIVTVNLWFEDSVMSEPFVGLIGDRCSGSSTKERSWMRLESRKARKPENVQDIFRWFRAARPS